MQVGKSDSKVLLCGAFWSQALEVALATMFAGACVSARMARKFSSMELTLTGQALNSMDGSTEPTFFHLLPALDTCRALTRSSRRIMSRWSCLSRTQKYAEYRWTETKFAPPCSS